MDFGQLTPTGKEQVISLLLTSMYFTTLAIVRQLFYYSGVIEVFVGTILKRGKTSYKVSFVVSKSEGQKHVDFRSRRPFPAGMAPKSSSRKPCSSGFFRTCFSRGSCRLIYVNLTIFTPLLYHVFDKT